MINHLSFGDPINFSTMRKHFPSAGSGNPLDGFSRRPEPKSDNDKKLKKMQNSQWISWKIIPNMLSQHIWKFTPVSYRTSALWGRCPALTPLHHWITPSRASGTADHVRSLDEYFSLLTSKSLLEFIHSFIQDASLAYMAWPWFFWQYNCRDWQNRH